MLQKRISKNIKVISFRRSVGLIYAVFPARSLNIVSASIQNLRADLEYQTDESKYFQPLSTTFECIDAWVVIDGETWVIQFTVGAAH